MFNRFFIYSVLLGVLVSGCAITQPLLSGKDISGNLVCLTDCSDIPGAIEKFRVVYDLEGKEGQTDYLLTRVQATWGKFVRNGEVFTSLETLQYIRWKMADHKKTHNEGLIVDRAFINDVLKGSTTTGLPYEFVLKDGSRHDVKFIMLNELDALEAYMDGSKN